MAAFDGLKNFPELEGSIDADVILGVQGPPGPIGPVGPRGPEGPTGKPFTYDDFTPEQLEKLRGPQGDPFTYQDFTPEQLEALRGNDGVTPHIGENGNWFIGETDTGVPAGGTSVLIVDITKDADEYYSSHSASEIKAHVENDGFVVGRYEAKNLLIDEITEEYVAFVYHKPGGSTSDVYRVFNDKTVVHLSASHRHSEMISTKTAQNFSNAQKSQARENIGALSKDEVTDAVNDALDQAKENGDLSADLSDEEYAELMALLEEE